jgi:putative transposase
MYEYRKLTPEQRAEVVRERLAKGFPPHSPPHPVRDQPFYLLTAACYEHKPIFSSPKSLTFLMQTLLNPFVVRHESAVEQPSNATPLRSVAYYKQSGSLRASLHAWVFLPNHYHLLLSVESLKVLSGLLRILHSRIALEMNRRDRTKGRRIWYRYSDRKMRSEPHYWATANYIHFNPVKHQYVEDIRQWAWSSWLLWEGIHGADRMQEIRDDYPIKEYGKGWDD